MPKEIDLSEFASTKGGPKCTVGISLPLLDKTQREKVLLALTSPEITHMMIARRLSEWTGINVKSPAVSRHRSKDCACER